MTELMVRTLLDGAVTTIADCACRGTCRHMSAEECTEATHLVFPYRGAFVRHAGRGEEVAEPNQMVFFNAGEPYRISHPVAGGDGCLSLVVHGEWLAELAPREAPRQRRRIDARAQALVALLRHSLRRGVAEMLEAETLALTLVRRALGERTSQAAGASAGRQKLVDRAKLVLASDLARRWTLAEVAALVRVSPVYLTQVFRQVEGMPLYRYQLRLRLARALDLLEGCEDLTALALELGFSSQSHFGAAFRQAYGRAPAEFQRVVRLR